MSERPTNQARRPYVESCHTVDSLGLPQHASVKGLEILISFTKTRWVLLLWQGCQSLGWASGCILRKCLQEHTWRWVGVFVQTVLGRMFPTRSQMPPGSMCRHAAAPRHLLSALLLLQAFCAVPRDEAAVRGWQNWQEEVCFPLKLSCSVLLCSIQKPPLRRSKSYMGHQRSSNNRSGVY